MLRLDYQSPVKEEIKRRRFDAVDVISLLLLVLLPVWIVVAMMWSDS